MTDVPSARVQASIFQDELQLQLKLFQLYHNKQELTEKREIADKKKEEVAKLEKRKEISDEETKSKRKELASYNKELAADEQKVNELVRRMYSVALDTFLPSGNPNQQESTDVHQSQGELHASSEETRSGQVSSGVRD